MEYIEFSGFQQINDEVYPSIKRYILDKDNSFYIEPIFYTKLQGMKMLHPNSFERIIDEMIQKVKINHKVIFVGDFETPYIEKDGYIYLEIEDITNALNIFVEDKSRGSDYGD